jgi:hypothetical protein
MKWIKIHGVISMTQSVEWALNTLKAEHKELYAVMDFIDEIFGKLTFGEQSLYDVKRQHYLALLAKINGCIFALLDDVSLGGAS